MSVAIDQADYRMRFPPIDNANSGRVEKDAKCGRDRQAKGGTQDSFDWTHMRDKRHSLIWMRLHQLFDNGHYTPLHSFQTFSAWRRKCAIMFPGEQMLSILCTTLHHFAATQAFPHPKVAFAEIF